MKKMKVGELVLDFDLYPRSNIDAHNVGTLREALAAGATLPPIVIDKKSKRVADGFHRTKAYINHFGLNHQVDVIEKIYATDADLFLDAMRFNAGHGAKLDAHDRTHCVILAERLQIPEAEVAAALSLPLDRIGELKVDRTATVGGLTVPIKRSIRWMAGKKLTKAQASANEKLSGMNQQFHANQLILLIENEMIDMADEALLDRLLILHARLSVLLARLSAKAA